MKLLNFGKHFIVSLAFALLMMSGCSSSEESSSGSSDDTSSGGSCENCSEFSGTIDVAECEVRNDMRDGC